MGKRLTAVLLALCLLSAGIGCAEEENGWFTEYGFAEAGCRLEGDTLYLPEGIECLGMYYDEETEEWLDPEFCFDGYGLTEYAETVPGDDTAPVEMIYRVKRIVLPESLITLGVEGMFGVDVDEIVVQEGVREIQAPFYGVRAKRLYLPSTVEKMDAGSFDEAWFDEIILAQDNPYFTVVDGVIFSKDLKTLVYYPSNREDAHYDVPKGTENIGTGAFRENHFLQSISLPIGLKKIEKSAFYACGRLISVNVPLTVTEIGNYAFCDCVSLQAVTLPPALQGLLEETNEDSWLVEDANCRFDNCPLLFGHGNFEGDNAGTSAKAWRADEYVMGQGDYFFAVATTGNANDAVCLYAKPDENSEIVGKAACGTVMHVCTLPETWETLRDRKAPEFLQAEVDFLECSCFVRLRDIVKAVDGLFSYARGSLRTRNDSVTCYHVPAPDARQYQTRSGNLNMQQAFLWRTGVPYAEVWDERNQAYVWLFLSDLTVKRVPIGDGKTYAIVTASAPENRVHLRESASTDSASLGKYFTGTQLEILGKKGDFYRVLVDGQEGYMMKKYVYIVPEAEN